MSAISFINRNYTTQARKFSSTVYTGAKKKKKALYQNCKSERE